MKPLYAGEIKGNWATVLLPINRDESIDWARLQDELDYIAAARVDGAYTNGTAGEFLTQTIDEFVKISQLIAEICEKNQIPFQIGASHASPQITLERVRIAREFRPGAIQVILPDWLIVSDEEAVAFLEKIAECAAPVPIVLYNPPHAKRVLAPADFGKLKQSVPQLVGIKVMDGNAVWYQEMRQHCRDLSVFVPGHHLATGFASGGAGAYSNIACLNPKGAQKWYESMKTDLSHALELERRIQEFFRLYISPFKTEQNYSNAALDKLLAAVGAWSNIGTRLRFPYRSIDEGAARHLSNVARKMLPELF